MPVDVKGFMDQADAVADESDAYTHLLAKIESWLPSIIDAVPDLPTFGTVETTLGGWEFCEITATWKQGNKLLRLYFRPSDIGYRFVVGNTSEPGMFPYTDFENARLLFEAFQKEN